MHILCFAEHFICFRAPRSKKGWEPLRLLMKVNAITFHCDAIYEQPLTQACTKYGPQVKCDPQKLLVWPAKPRTLCIQLVSLNNQSPFEWEKHIYFNFSPWAWEIFCLGPTMRFELCNPALTTKTEPIKIKTHFLQKSRISSS